MTRPSPPMTCSPRTRDSIVSGDLFADNGLGPDFDIDNGAVLQVIEIDGVAVSDGQVVTLGTGAKPDDPREWRD